MTSITNEIATLKSLIREYEDLRDEAYLCRALPEHAVLEVTAFYDSVICEYQEKLCLLQP